MNLLGSGEIIRFENVFAKMVPGTVWRVMGIKEDGSFTLERMKEFNFVGPTNRTVVSDDGSLTIMFGERQVINNGEVEILTATEWKLLEVLVGLDGQAISHESLLGFCWGPEYSDDKQYLRVWISRLRSKIGRHRIETHNGFGYTFTLNPDEVLA